MVLREAGGRLRCEDVPRPEPRPDEVLVQVRACGIGLTLEWTRIGRWSGTNRPAGFPRIIGHEIAGDIVESADTTGTWTVGDRVVVYYYLTCGMCRACAGGRESLCEDLRGYVGRQLDGGLADYVTIPIRNLRRLPRTVDYVDGAVAADALATPLHVLRARAAVQPGETVLVVGAGGGVGVHMVQMARALGSRPLAVDIGAKKLEIARAAGAVAAWDSTDGPFHEAVEECTHGRGADVVVEMVGTEATVHESVRSLSRVGRLVQVGTYQPETPLGLAVKWARGEQAIMSSKYCNRAEVSQVLDMVAYGTVKPVIGRPCSLEEADDVLAAVVDGQVAGRAVAVL